MSYIYQSLRAPQTIYDFDFTTAPTDAGMADAATKTYNGLTWTFRKGTNTAGVVDSNGLNFNFTGVASATPLFTFLMSDLGLDPFSSKYRVSVYHNVPPSTAQDIYLGPFVCSSQSSAATAIGIESANVATVATTRTYNLLGGTVTSTDAALNGTRDVSIFENLGGVFTMRKGTYSSGFPAIGTCPIQMSAPVLASLLNGATTGLTTAWYFALYGANSAYVATPVSATFKRVTVQLL